jgi:hypothetical protein
MDRLSDQPTSAHRAHTLLDVLHAHKHSHHQDRWAYHPNLSGTYTVDLDDLTNASCGTAACAAGWTVALEGLHVGSDARVFARADDNTRTYVGYAAHVAAGILQLNLKAANRLFYKCDTLDDVTAFIYTQFGPRPADMPPATYPTPTQPEGQR